VAIKVSRDQFPWFFFSKPTVHMVQVDEFTYPVIMNERMSCM